MNGNQELDPAAAQAWRDYDTAAAEQAWRNYDSSDPAAAAEAWRGYDSSRAALLDRRQNAMRMSALARQDAYQQDNENPFERAALTRRRTGLRAPDERPPSGLSGEFLIAQGPLDYGTNALAYPLPPVAKAAALGFGALFEPREAQAGVGGIVRRALDPQFWHGISVNKLRKPMSEMFAERTPTQVINERFITPEALQGGLLLPAIGDRSIAGMRLTKVGDQTLAIPTELQGGHGFMAADSPHIWASDKGKITRLVNEATRASAKEGGAPVYLPYTAMGPRAIDFSHHMSDTLSEMVKGADFFKTSKNPKIGTAATFDKTMKSDTADFAAVKEWPGVKDPDLRHWLMNQPGEVRNKFAKLMEANLYQRSGFPNVAEARFAVTDPRLMHDPMNAAGMSIARIDPGAIGTSAHRTYSTGLGGEYVGGFGRSIPPEIMYPDIMAAYAKNYPTTRPDYLMERLAPPTYQRADQQWLDRIMPYWRGDY